MGPSSKLPPPPTLEKLSVGGGLVLLSLPERSFDSGTPWGTLGPWRRSETRACDLHTPAMPHASADEVWKVYTHQTPEKICGASAIT